MATESPDLAWQIPVPEADNLELLGKTVAVADKSPYFKSDLKAINRDLETDLVVGQYVEVLGRTGVWECATVVSIDGGSTTVSTRGSGVLDTIARDEATHKIRARHLLAENVKDTVWLRAEHGRHVTDLQPFAASRHVGSSASEALVAELFDDNDVDLENVMEVMPGRMYHIENGELYVYDGSERQALSKIFLAEISSSPVPDKVLPGAHLITVQTAPATLNMFQDRNGPIDTWVFVASSDKSRVIFMDALACEGAINSDSNIFSPLGSPPVTLGKGSSANVQCIRKADGTQVAVKHLTDSADLNAVEREMAMLVACQNHIHVVAFLGTLWSSTRGKPSLVFEMAPYGDVLKMVSARGPMSEKASKSLFAGCIAGIHYLHHRYIVHRDIKSENVLLRDNHCAMITDFGLAADIRDAEQLKRRCGSPGYAAPEICAGKPYGVKVDIFGAGAVLYFMLSGKLPFKSPDGQPSATMRLTMKCELQLGESPWDGMSKTLRNFLRLLMAKHQQQRLDARQALEHSWLVRTVAKATANAAGMPSMSGESTGQAPSSALSVLKSSSNSSCDCSSRVSIYASSSNGSSIKDETSPKL